MSEYPAQRQHCALPQNSEHSGHVHYPTMERHCDVAVIGGSAAGLAAALQLARQRRSVVVIDDGTPRNAPAAHLHGHLGHEGAAPEELIDLGCAEVRSYGGELLTGRVVGMRRGDDGRFRLDLTGGHTLVARRVLVATGLTDQPPVIDALAASGVVIERKVARILTGPDGEVSGAELSDGGTVEADALVVDPRGGTTVSGVYAAGNVTDPSLQVLPAAAQGSHVGAMIDFNLAEEDLRNAARLSGEEADWDHRYSGADRAWSGNPNGTLVHEVTDLTPGRALDVGAGEGADALWLAEHGWKVTATDISGNALARVRAEAERRGLAIDLLRSDVNDPAPFGTDTFDLVSLQYGSFKRTPDQCGLRSLLAAVAPGGTLLVVHHDLTGMLEPVDVATQTRMYDPEAFVGVEEVAAALTADPETWHIELHETRPRPPGAASAHHVADVVLRATRRTI